MFDFQEKSSALAGQMPIAHGPRNMLARFVRQVERVGTERGVRFAIETDFAAFNEAAPEIRRTGGRITPNFNPAYGYDGSNGWWVSARNAAGELVATVAGRVYEWPDTNLAAELESFRFLYGDAVEKFRKPMERCEVSAAFARKITGRVCYGGGGWVRPDMRGKGLSAILPRLSKAYAVGRHDFDWSVAIVEPVLVRKGVAKRYGFNHIEFGVHFSGTPFGDYDLAMCWMDRDEFVDDLAEVELHPELLDG